MNTVKKNPRTASKQQYNEAVKTAYFKLLKETTRLIATIERHDLRFTLQRTDKGEIAPFKVLHEFISPIVYMAIKSMDGEHYKIHWGIEQFDDECDYSHITAHFLRMLYKLTSAEYTPINIENCINTDSIITHCSELYECVEDNNHYHQFILIKHKVTASQRKRMLSVA
jgi:hypothetical protein